MALTSQTIIVTGGAGFVGSNLCERLVKDGHRVISLDNYFAGSSENHIEGVEYRTGHTKDIEMHVPETPDLIYHLGEYARVEQSLLEPDVVHDLNILGTEGVLNFWQARKCKLVYAGSSTKFGDGGKARDVTPYASTKAANTEKVREIGETQKLPYAITYFYNVYGPRERSGLYGTLIETYKQMYLSGLPLAVTSPGTQKRNFTYVGDIIDALVLVGERGQGDEYGLGNEESFSIIEVARMFGGEIVMLPPRAGNRMISSLDANKMHSLGWSPKVSLTTYIGDFVATHSRGRGHDRRVLVFSTTFYPVVGPAELALIELIKQMSEVQFDIVTTVHKGNIENALSPAQNATVHRVGWGTSFDKFFLPILGARKGHRLAKKHRYLFAWSLMASYGTGAALSVRRSAQLPLLVTLADQRITWYAKLFLSLVLRKADQVYASLPQHEKYMSNAIERRSIGTGDAFANQLRYSYAEILLRNS